MDASTAGCRNRINFFFLIDDDGYRLDVNHNLNVASQFMEWVERHLSVCRALKSVKCFVLHIAIAPCVCLGIIFSNFCLDA